MENEDISTVAPRFRRALSDETLLKCTDQSFSSEFFGLFFHPKAEPVSTLSQFGFNFGVNNYSSFILSGLKGPFPTATT